MSSAAEPAAPDRATDLATDVALVRAEGAEPFFTWGFDPLTSVP